VTDAQKARARRIYSVLLDEGYFPTEAEHREILAYVKGAPPLIDFSKLKKSPRRGRGWVMP
jgi:hypothetical protein